jgi:short-subunit dehydrogenase
MTDVAKVEELAARAVKEFGRLDVWVNNAAVGAFGLLTEIPPNDFQRVLDVNISGYVNGARAALPRLRAQGSGTLINVASIVSEIPLPYSAAYSISKAAVRALSVSLRSELAREGVDGVHVCTVLPATIDTPFYQNAANYTGRRPMAMPPVYTPERVAKAVVGLVDHPRRETVAGGLAGRLLVLQHKVTPGAVEAATARQVDTRQLSRRQSAPLTSGNLHQASQAIRKASTGGGWHGRRRTAQRLVGTAAVLAAAASPSPDCAVPAAGLTAAVPGVRLPARLATRAPAVALSLSRGSSRRRRAKHPARSRHPIRHRSWRRNADRQRTFRPGPPRTP